MDFKKILIIIDGSYLNFICNFRGFNKWSQQYASLDTCIIRPPEESDQENLPDIVNESKWFKKCLHNAAIDKINEIANIIENDTGILYPKSKFIDTVIAKDSKLVRSFRYSIYPEYKLTRRINRAKRGQYKIGPVFEELYNNIYPSIFGTENTYQIAVDGAEGDDIVASLSLSRKIADEYERIILFSSDRDFVQLQINRPVTQYGQHGELVVPKIKRGNSTIELTPKQALLIKIISGDKSDNIHPIRAKIGEVKAYKFITEKTDEFKKMIKEEPEVAKNFILNSKLIDFSNIPEELRNKIVDEFYNLKTKNC